MNLKACYERMGGDYEAVTGRLRGEERVIKFLRLFLKDDSYNSLCTALEAGDGDTAFRAAHTLKGVCQNLALTQLYESSAALTEALRGGVIGDVAELLAKVQADYQLTIDAVNELDA